MNRNPDPPSAPPFRLLAEADETLEQKVERAEREIAIRRLHAAMAAELPSGAGYVLVTTSETRIEYASSLPRPDAALVLSALLDQFGRAEPGVLVEPTADTAAFMRQQVLDMREHGLTSPSQITEHLRQSVASMTEAFERDALAEGVSAAMTAATLALGLLDSYRQFVRSRASEGSERAS